jgi:hypothetical protein
MSDSKIPSYSHPLAWTHKHAEELRACPDLVYQEKVDGSQVSFRREEDGTISARSRNADCAGNAMFDRLMAALQVIGPYLAVGWTYRGEYLRTPKHNTLAYARVPRHHVVLFDVDRGLCDYMGPEELAAEGERIGLEVVPTWRHEGAPDPAWLAQESFLGGCVAEGWVAKAYGLLGPDSKVLMAKEVRASFKEAHKVEWRKANPTTGDKAQAIAAAFCTEARWLKAVQHLRESGALVEAPEDIGALMREVPQDLERDVDDIKEELWKAFRAEILRASTRGLPEWYKGRLSAGGGEG